MGLLSFERSTSARILRDFRCGIKEMDDFIHFRLDNYLSQHENQLFIVYDEDNTIVGMFVLSEGYFFDENESFTDAPAYGKPFSILDKFSGDLKSIKRYSTVEIEYLAVSESNRNKHIGSFIIRQISKLAKSQHTPFITVDAYVTIHYTAVPFYEKCGFIHLENQDRGYDTMRMILNISQPTDN